MNFFQKSFKKDTLSITLNEICVVYEVFRLIRVESRRKIEGKIMSEQSPTAEIKKVASEGGGGP